MIRNDPKNFGVEAVKLAMNHPLGQKLKKDPLLTYLRKSGKISPVYFESEALQAVRQNNTAKVALAEKVPTKGGNVEQYTTIIG